ncbi:MAG: hypothetical protein LBB25_04600 [Holosporaceae bacterium]|jgi:hypothetical protein|nr:hypothetical protein [Holosporaceae bacterium]
MLIRGIRALSAGYHRHFADIPDTEENLSTEILLESKDENCCITTADCWPDFVMLDASLTSLKIFSNAILERSEESRFRDEIALYNYPRIDSQSNIQNFKSCCSKIIVNFENTGKYLLENEINVFVGNNFGDYQINFLSNHIFEKEFLTCQNSISEIADQSGSIIHEDTFAKCKIYPYGGLFEYGMHPKQMESCVFRTVHDETSLYLRILPLSVLRSLDIDPTADQRMESGYQFVGIKDFSVSQKTNLYDEIKDGFCQIEIVNRNTNERSIYKSNAVLFMPKTNLISINFIKEQE